MSDSPRDEARLTAIYRCLSNTRRRHALESLNEAGEPVALADLAEDVAHRETGTRRGDLADEVVKEVYTALYHNHVPRLAEADLVEYDRERDAVALSEFPEQLRRDDHALSAD